MPAPDPTPAPDAAPEIDWTSNGIETKLGWSLTAMYQGYSRAGSVAVADVPGGPRSYQVLVAITTEQPTSQLALAHRLGKWRICQSPSFMAGLGLWRHTQSKREAPNWGTSYWGMIVFRQPCAANLWVLRPSDLSETHELAARARDHS
ncbi:hypothetical protein [Cryobacterium zongtaii]|uniref:hypothetical protein n=1 Tax=Cryobacterium zongtaii TaxID=1259217 RepID=UPI001AD83DAD|nr:hypothetical protein [Cryobacterium zongtaii]